MGQERFHPRLAGGLVVGYVGFLCLVISLVSGSWYVTVFSAKAKPTINIYTHKGLFSVSNVLSRVSQSMMVLSFIVNITACVVGMISSFAVTRPRVAGFAIKNLRVNSERLVLGPQVSGWLYIASGLFTIIAVSVAFGTNGENEHNGYSAILACVSLPFTMAAGGLLIWPEPPHVPYIGDEDDKNIEEPIDKKSKKNSKRKKKDKAFTVEEVSIQKDQQTQNNVGQEENNQKQENLPLLDGKEQAV